MASIAMQISKTLLKKIGGMGEISPKKKTKLPESINDLWRVGSADGSPGDIPTKAGYTLVSIMEGEPKKSMINKRLLSPFFFFFFN